MDRSMNRIIDKNQHEDNNLNRDVMQCESKRQAEQWQRTEFVVQGHAFDGRIEEQALSVFDFLMKAQHDIISFKMCDRLAECWLSQRVEWHIERGLKLNLDGSPCLQGRPCIISQINTMPVGQRKLWSKEARQVSFCISSFKPGSQTAHMVSSGAPISAQSYA